MMFLTSRVVEEPAKAQAKAAVSRREQLVRCGPLALLLPQAAQAHGGAQLPGFGLLATGYGEGLLEAGFGLGRLRTGLAQEEFALQPIRFRQQVTPPACLQHRQSLGQQAQPLLHLANMPRGLG